MVPGLIFSRLRRNVCFPVCRTYARANQPEHAPRGQSSWVKLLMM
jgi:hypothetical protein